LGSTFLICANNNHHWSFLKVTLIVGCLGKALAGFFFLGNNKLV
jgi:hypothetical protein